VTVCPGRLREDGLPETGWPKLRRMPRIPQRRAGVRDDPRGEILPERALDHSQFGIMVPRLFFKLYVPRVLKF